MPTAEEQRAKLFDSDEADRESDTKIAYAEVTKSIQGKAGPVGTLQKIGKLWLKWDSEPRPKTRARRALQQLVGVPTAENANWNFESALRDALASAMNEEAEAETNRWNASEGEEPNSK